MPLFRPFMLAHPLEDDSKIDLQHYAAEWKWDGIRGQLILRGGQHHVWSRGEELLTERFPELELDATRLDGPLVRPRGAIDVDTGSRTAAQVVELTLVDLGRRLGHETGRRRRLGERDQCYMRRARP